MAGQDTSMATAFEKAFSVIREGITREEMLAIYSDWASTYDKVSEITILLLGTYLPLIKKEMTEPQLPNILKVRKINTIFFEHLLFRLRHHHLYHL